MRALHVVEAEWPLSDGQDVFYASNELPDGTVLVEPAIVHSPAPEGAAVHVRMLGGSSLEAATEQNSGPRVLREVAPEHAGARAALCYEPTGTVVSVQVLVDETDPDAAMAAVTQALEPLARDLDEPVARVALDRFHHVLDVDGRLLGADVPHWKIPWRSVYLAPAQTPVHEVIYEFLTERSQRAEGLRQASAQRSAATRQERGSQRGGRKPVLTAAQQAQIYDDDRAGTETRKHLAARYQISVPTLAKYLRAERELREHQGATANGHPASA